MKNTLRKVKTFCLKYRRSLRLNRWPTGDADTMEWEKSRKALKEKLKDIW